VEEFTNKKENIGKRVRNKKESPEFISKWRSKFKLQGQILEGMKI